MDPDPILENNSAPHLVNNSDPDLSTKKSDKKTGSNNNQIQTTKQKLDPDPNHRIIRIRIPRYANQEKPTRKRKIPDHDPTIQKKKHYPVLNFHIRNGSEP